MTNEYCNIPVVEISSWAGISIGAEHCYATLYHPTEELSKERLTRGISREEAAYLNKKDTWSGWEEGDVTERFNTEEEIRDAIIELNKKHGYPLIVEGSYSVAEPQRIIYCTNEEFKTAMNVIHEEFSRHEWDEGHDEMKDRLCDQWYELVGDFIRNKTEDK